MTQNVYERRHSRRLRGELLRAFYRLQVADRVSISIEVNRKKKHQAFIYLFSSPKILRISSTLGDFQSFDNRNRNAFQAVD